MKILVIQQKMIGDVLTSSILFEALRKKYPSAELHYLIYKHTVPVVAHNPNIDHLILYDPARDEKPGGFLDLIRRIRKEKYHVVIDVYSKINSAVITALSHAEKRISYHKIYTRWAYTRTFTPKKKLDTCAGFAIENRMQLLQAISGDFPLEIKPRIYLTSDERKEAAKKLTDAGILLDAPLVMCGILGSSASKTYPLDKMGQVLDFLVAKTGAQLLFNYIPNQKNQAQSLLEYCHPRTRRHIYFEVFGNSLREFMSLTYHCDALIGNEGGAVNMAKALGIPTFSIFSPQIKKENWSIYEDGKKNISVHLNDFFPEALRGLKKQKIVKNSRQFYDLLKPNLIFAPLEEFIKINQLRDSGWEKTTA